MENYWDLRRDSDSRFVPEDRGQHVAFWFWDPSSFRIYRNWDTFMKNLGRHNTFCSLSTFVRNHPELYPVVKARVRRNRV